VIAGLLLGLSLLQTAREEGVLVVRSDTQEVARESFTFAQGRLSGGAQGWTLSATARYDRVRPVIVLSPTLEISADSQPVTLQFDIANPREPMRVLGQLGRQRYTVRTVARSVERAREFPVEPPLVVLDDSVFAPYRLVAWHAGPEPARVTAVVPRATRRDVLTVTAAGSESIVVNGRSVTARHVTVSGGPNELVHLWLDDRGSIVRLAIPSRRLVAERAPTD
jgi:hypothetical protein